jgi:hypothetical protein
MVVDSRIAIGDKAMARKEDTLDNWIPAEKAAEILTANSGHAVSQAYVRMLARNSKISFKQVDGRTRLYSKSDISKYQVGKRGDGSVRPWFTRLPKSVKLLNSDGIWFECGICGQRWSPNIQPGGKFPRGGKKCPNGCTATEEAC